MINDLLNVVYFDRDADFDYLYPKYVQKLSEIHWTPLAIAKISCGYLSQPNSKVLDIGSGIGKFCLAAGFHQPETFFYGVEQRKDLHNLAQSVKDTLNMSNVKFIHGNVIDLDFDLYDSFYFYNSFYENVTPNLGIDNTIEANLELYQYYTDFVYNRLDERPSGTKLVTYYGAIKQIPSSYKLIDNSRHFALKLWMKE